MAAPITTSATTLEGQLVEVINALDAQERVYNTANPASPKNQVSVSLDPDNQTMNFSAQLAATVSGSGGNISFAAVAYLP